MGRALSIKPEALHAHLGTRHWPVVFDVRRGSAFEIAEAVLPTAEWRNHREAASWGAEFRDSGCVVYCAHGEHLSQGVAALLAAVGVNAAYLEGGISAWRSKGGATVARERLAAVRRERPSRWVAALRHSLDHLACAWLIRRFIEPDALFAAVPPALVTATAQEFGILSFALLEPPAAKGAYPGGFAALLRHFAIADPALDRLGALVQADEAALAASAPGTTDDAGSLAATAKGLVLAARDDAELLDGAGWLFDGLYRSLCQGLAGADPAGD